MLKYLKFWKQRNTSDAGPGFARRTSIGVEHNRLNMILAVLERRAGISLSMQDVYVNIVGGIRPEGTASDLAVALAVYSSYTRKTAPAMTIALGEIGLTGELRSVQHTDKIMREAYRMGFKRIVMPEKNAAKLKASAPADFEVIGVKTLREALQVFSEN